MVVNKTPIEPQQTYLLYFATDKLMTFHYAE
jgi:hypothetical protein